MAKRQRWKDELKSTLLTDEDRLKKKPKIEILEDVVYKDGIKLRSTLYPKTKFKSSPEYSSLPTTPHSSKPAQVSVKDLTPTFRKPRSYMSETKRIIENISTMHSTQQKDKKSNDFAQTSTSLEMLSNVSISDLIQNTSHASYNCLDTVDDDESLVSLGVYAVDCPKNKDCLPYPRMKSPCTAEDSPENKDCLPNTLMKSPCTAEYCLENKDCLPYPCMKSPFTAKDSPENKDCLPNTLMKSPCTAEYCPENKDCLPYAHMKSPCTAEDSPESKACLPNTLLESPCTAKKSSENKDNTDCLQNVRRIQTTLCTAEDSSAEKSKDCFHAIPQKFNFMAENSLKDKDCLTNVHNSSLYTNKITPEKMDDVPVTDNKYYTADYEVQVSSSIPIDTNIKATISTNSQESSKRIGTKRNCRRKLSFDKCHLDFIEEEDADTLLLNEAFPSEESSCAFDSDETSDDSLSGKAGKTKSKTKRGKKLMKRISKKKKFEEIVPLTKAKPKKDIKKEDKIKKTLGQTYINEKGTEVQSKSMKPNPCNDVKCKRNCGDIPETRRQELFNFYWKLGSCQRQRDWIAKCAIKKNTAKKTTDKGESSRRKFSFEYYINEGEGRRQVCQKFLLNTLDITQRFLGYTLDNANEGFAKLDERGKNGGTNKTSEDTVDHAKKFISSLPLVPSHYCRKDSNKLYLPDDFKSMSNLYRIYEKNCIEEIVKQMSLKVFSNWLKDNYNIGIHVPKKDKCVVCMTQTFDVKNYEEMTKYNSHIQEKEESYKRFKCHQNLNDIDPSIICASFDMQKVLNTPHGNSMALYYSRKIAVYNLTIYESNTQMGFCNVWTEVDARRGANEISTCLLTYLQEVDKRGNVKTVLLYCDSCYGQNKNKTMLSMLRYFMSIAINVEVIQINYLIPGHTYMPVDSMHSVIEHAVKNTTVWAPSQWSTIIEMARRKPFPYRVSILEGSDFIGFEGIQSKTFKKNQKIQISKLCIATFKKTNPDVMFIKNSMLPDAETASVSLCSLDNSQPKLYLYSNKLPVSIQKYEDLKKLVDKKIIPKRYAHEYLKLKHDKKVKDTLLETDEEEEGCD